MTGTFLNVATIAGGSLIGVALGSRLPERMQTTVLQGLGLLTLVIGTQMTFKSQNILIVLGAILGGGILGEALRLDMWLERAGALLQRVLSRGGGRGIADGFITGTLVFCVGPMAILGSIQDGLTGDFQLLAVKSTLDGFASIAFAASLGWGVLFSAISIFLYQGAITLFAGTLEHVLTDPMIAELTATGGLIIVGIGLKLLAVKEIPLANFLPALAIAPFLVWFVPVIRTLF